jgi:hypothetical protein
MTGAEEIADARPTLEQEIEHALNRHCAENGSDTPDFILAKYLLGALAAWNSAIVAREKWYGRDIHGPMMAIKLTDPSYQVGEPPSEIDEKCSDGSGNWDDVAFGDKNPTKEICP